MGTNKSYIVSFTIGERGNTMNTTVTAKSRMDARAKVVQRNLGKKIRIIAVSER